MILALLVLLLSILAMCLGLVWMLSDDGIAPLATFNLGLVTLGLSGWTLLPAVESGQLAEFIESSGLVTL